MYTGRSLDGDLLKKVDELNPCSEKKNLNCIGPFTGYRRTYTSIYKMHLFIYIYNLF